MTDGDLSIIDERIFRFLKGRATAAEAAELTAWRHASPEHEAHFLRLAGMLDVASKLDLEQPMPAPPSMAELTGAARASRDVISLPVDTARRRRVTGRRRLRHIGGLAAAAATVILLSIGVFRGPQVPLPAMQLAAAEYITGVGETAVVTLGDGSVVRLAPESRLRVTPHEDRREVSLEGRAFFAVTGNRDLPFIVETASGRARVLGTRFDLEARSSEMRVVVVEGRVEMTTPDGSIDLGAQELSWSSPGRAPGRTKVEDVQDLLEWLDHFIVFQATPLADVAREIEQRFGVEVRITRPELARETVTGWSNSRTAADIVTRVCLAVNARCELSDTLVVLHPYR